MADTRIQVAKDKVNLLRMLKEGGESTAPFMSYADVLLFAAIIGVRNCNRVKLNSVSREGLVPIPQDQFRDPVLIGLLAVCETSDFGILKDDDALDRQRIEIFQEYANGGLEIISQKIFGTVDYTEQLLLMLKFGAQ